MFMHIVVKETVVRAIICSLRSKKMLHVYYVSYVLIGIETRYTSLEKYVFCLVMSARKLRPYLQAHPVTIFRNVP